MKVRKSSCKKMILGRHVYCEGVDNTKNTTKMDSYHAILVQLSLQLPHAFFFIVAMKRNYNFSILPPFNYNPTS